MTVENFVGIVWAVFEKKSENDCFLLFLESQSYDFDAIARTRAPLGE